MLVEAALLTVWLQDQDESTMITEQAAPQVARDQEQPTASVEAPIVLEEFLDLIKSIEELGKNQEQ